MLRKEGTDRLKDEEFVRDAREQNPKKEVEHIEEENFVTRITPEEDPLRGPPTPPQGRLPSR